MTNSLNNRSLLAYHNELEQTKSSVYYMLNKSRIDDFYKRNKLRIQGIYDKVKDLHVKYFHLDENGKIKTEDYESIENMVKKTKKRRLLLDGMTLADYEEEFEKIMNQTLNIIF